MQLRQYKILNAPIKILYDFSYCKAEFQIDYEVRKRSGEVALIPYSIQVSLGPTTSFWTATRTYKIDQIEHGSIKVGKKLENQLVRESQKRVTRLAKNYINKLWRENKKLDKEYELKKRLAAKEAENKLFIAEKSLFTAPLPQAKVRR